MYSTKLSKRTFNDLTKILDYPLRKYGSHQKEVYQKKIIGGIRNVGQMPTIGYRRRDLRVDLLSYVSGQHVLIYAVDEKAKMVTIIRILHSRMNFSGKV